jgi:hypothetical protein
VNEDHALMTGFDEFGDLERGIRVSIGKKGDDGGRARERRTLSKAALSRFVRLSMLPGLPLTPRKCCSRGTGRKEASKKKRPV